MSDVTFTIDLANLPWPLAITFGVLAILLILAGRRTLWLFIGAAIALIPYVVMTAVGTGLSPTSQFLVALAIGLVAGLLSLLIPAMLVVLGGLVVGLGLTEQFIGLIIPANLATETVRTVVGLLVSATLIWAAWRHRDDAFILMSVLLGVTVLLQDILTFDVNRAGFAILWLALCLLGVVVQYATLQRERRAQRLAAPPALVPAPTGTGLA